MIVLAINCGSSSLKFQLFARHTGDPPGGMRVAGGHIDRLGADAIVTLQMEKTAGVRTRESIPDHAAAVHRVLAWLSTSGAIERHGDRIDGVGHRVVHGGARLTAPVRIDAGIVAAIEALEPLAPLHNAPSLAGIRAAQTSLGPTLPMIAVFDTAFHATIPVEAALYAIASELAEKHQIRRYGFHGLAYQSVLEQYVELSGTPRERATLVAFHLGNGCSAVAIKNGQSVDTSMGFTPLEGLVMGTRSGDVDPGLVGHLARAEGVSVSEVERWLNERSGLLGLSGRSHDMRDLLDRQHDDTRARVAVDVFCRRARKYLGAYLAVLGGADAVLFSGGIGEHAPEVRARICAGLEWTGLIIDPDRNGATVGQSGRLTADGARLPAYVIPADEERVIARDTMNHVAHHSRRPA